MYLCPFVLFGHVKVRVELFSNLAHVQQSGRDNYMEEKTQQKLTAWQPTEHLK